MIISFSGLDGAGKTTQIHLFEEHLLSLGHRVGTLTMYDQVSTSARLRKWWRVLTRSENGSVQRQTIGIGNTKSRQFRRDKNYFSWPVFLLRLAAYLVDGIVLRVRLAQAARRYDFLILDRFIYDSLANLVALRNNKLVRGYIRVMLLLTRNPDVAVFLDVSPEEAFKRKPEYPLEYMRERSLAYRVLFEMLPQRCSVLARGNKNKVFATVRERVDELTVQA